MIVKRIILLLTISALTFSCEERFDTELEPENTGLLVVEGMLTNENINHRVKLTHPHLRSLQVDRPGRQRTAYPTMKPSCAADISLARSRAKAEGPSARASEVDSATRGVVEDRTRQAARR